MLVLFGGAGLVLASMVWAMTADSVRARDWVEVPATVVDSGLRERASTGRTRGGPVFQAHAQYRYTFGGREYTGSRLDGNGLGGFDNIGNWHQATAERMAAAKDAGRPIVVFVNPADPGEAIADRSIRWLLVSLVGVMAIAFLGTGGFGLYLALAGPRDVGNGVAVEWVLGIFWTMFSGVLLAVCIAGGQWLGGVVLLLFVAIGVLIIWSAVEKTFGYKEKLR